MFQQQPKKTYPIWKSLSKRNSMKPTKTYPTWRMKSLLMSKSILSRIIVQYFQTPVIILKLVILFLTKKIFYKIKKKNS